jgi:hypothetical protein
MKIAKKKKVKPANHMKSKTLFVKKHQGSLFNMRDLIET